MAQRQMQRQQQRQQQQQSQSQPRSQPQSQQQGGDEEEYFDLTGDGLGYLNRIRTVTPKSRKSEAFVACSITALRGRVNAAQYSKFDLNVTGTQAKEAIELLKPDVMEKKKVIVGFRVADYYPAHFTYHKENEQGKKEAHIGDVMKGRLLRLKFAKVDGEKVMLPGTDKESGSDAEGEGAES